MKKLNPNTSFMYKNENIYCLGFAFNEAKDKVVLIQKNRPTWQAGKYNGVGGKVEYDEPPNLAMIREFREETTINIPSFTEFATMTGSDFQVHCFVAFDDYIDLVESATDEKVAVCNYPEVLNLPDIIPNLRWLMPLALDSELRNAYIRLH